MSTADGGASDTRSRCRRSSDDISQRTRPAGTVTDTGVATMEARSSATGAKTADVVLTPDIRRQVACRSNGFWYMTAISPKLE